MTEPDRSHESHDSLQEFLSVLSRRRVVLLLAIVLTPVGALLYSILQTPLHQGSASVLATSGGAAGALSEIPGLSSAEEPERTAATHVGLARLPAVAERVIDKAPLFEDPETFLQRSSVWAEADSDILRFAVVDPDSEAAKRLATLYAEEFTSYRNQLDLRSIRTTRATIERTMSKLAATGQRGSALYRELQRAVRQLDAAEAVQGSAAIVVQPAVTTVQVQPRTMRNIVLGMVLGLVLGVAIAFLVDRLDTRVRTAEEIESVVGLPILGELPSPPEMPERGRTVSMVEFPYGPYAEGVRKLRSNVEFANLDVGARTIMVTSAVEGEGKTTTASDLAVALARSGRKVALCDLDARAPALDRAFGIGGARGLVEVAFGMEPLEHVLFSIDLTAAARVGAVPVSSRDGGGRSAASRRGQGDELTVVPGSTPIESSRGQLNVLPFGRRKPPNPGDFVGSSAVRQLVADLADTHDVVVIDTAPLVPVSDALSVSEYVDATLIVSAMGITRKPLLRTVRKLVSVFPARVLGLVVTGVPATSGYGEYYVPGPGPGERASVAERRPAGI